MASEGTPTTEELWQLVQKQREDIAELRALTAPLAERDAPPGPASRTRTSGRRRISRAGLLKAATMGVAGMAGAEVLGSLGAPRAEAAIANDTEFDASGGTGYAFRTYDPATGNGVYSYQVGVDVSGQVFGVQGVALDSAGFGNAGTGVYGYSGSGTGVSGDLGSESGRGVSGKVAGSALSAPPPGGTGVQGATSTGIGVLGESILDNGGSVSPSSGVGVKGTSGSGEGVYGHSDSSNGIHGNSGSLTDSGVWGDNTGAGYGVAGSTTSTGTLSPFSTAGVWGNNAGTGIGVKGTSASGYGVYGSSEGTHGIIGTTSSSGSGGVCGSVTDPVSSGVWGSNSGSGPGTKGTSSSGPGGFFSSAAGVPLHLDPGGTTGHPTSGTFVVGDVYVDAAGSMFLCTKGGTYGTNTPPVWGQVHLTQPIPLVPGWNLVAGPGLSTDVIAQQINAAGGNVQTIAVYSQGRYVTWVPNYSTPFYVPPTDGMFVLTKTPATWTPH